MSQEGNSEEIDISSLIKAIKSLFQSVSRLISRGVTSIKNFLRYLLFKFKFISLIAIIGGLIGLIFHYFQETHYESSLILKMNIDAREQLTNDISFFNSLTKDEEFEKLSEILNISNKEATTLKGIEIRPYIPEVERLQNHINIYTSLDSNVRELIGFNLEMLNTINDLSYISNKFKVILVSTNPSISAEIEGDLLSFISKRKELNQKLDLERTKLEFRERALSKQLSDLDTLKSVLNDVLIESSKSKNTQAQTTIHLNQSEGKDQFNIIEVHKRYRKIAFELAEISSKIKKLNGVYTVEASFSEFSQISNYPLSIKVIFGIACGIVASVLMIFLGFLSKNP